ncbi:MAG: membrane protein insertion efficiency factor YidD [Acidobacteria bacterium]|nr:membrane protein insertion efficiency factor YidD [Acidobacteriota bacterium]
MKRVLLTMIRVYRRFVSPMLGQHCRFDPSCSEYAMLAIEEWGAARGAALAAWRILRCQPFSAGGVDFPPRRRDCEVDG